MLSSKAILYIIFSIESSSPYINFLFYRQPIPDQLSKKYARYSPGENKMGLY